MRVLLFLLFGLAGCATTDQHAEPVQASDFVLRGFAALEGDPDEEEAQPRDWREQQRELRIAEIELACGQHATLALAEIPAIGMTRSCLLAAFDYPDDINRTVTARAQREQWVYRDLEMYIYLTDGIVTAFQD
ncbi:hypothetical protein [Hyphobacterium sp.]|uniref:hypothetical protein n=1 Tax=Hyphobacterium sp. TaxID=2004662 RepID=UPI003BABEA7C